MSALEGLVAAYEHGPDRGPVVGYLGADVPRELIVAAGLVPLRLRGSGLPSPLAESILGPRVDPPVRRILAALLDGRVPVDFLLLSHDSDSTVRLYDSLRVLARDGPPLPELGFLDLLHLPAETTAEYDLLRLGQVKARLEGWSGQAITVESLRGAIREENAVRRLVARLGELRRGLPARLSGADALAALGAGTVLPAAGYARLLEALLAEELPVRPEPMRRVYLTGSGHDSIDLYRAIESDGSVVVGEDHDWGEALFSGLVAEDADPLAAIAARYHSGSPLAHRRETNVRAEHTAREAEAAAADVVLAWIRTGDDALAWGLPAQRRAVEARDIRFLASEQRGPGAGDAAALGALA